MTRRKATQAELAQLVLDTPDLVAKLAINCVVASPTLTSLSTEEQRAAVVDMTGVLHSALTSIARGGQ